MKFRPECIKHDESAPMVLVNRELQPNKNKLQKLCLLRLVIVLVDEGN